MIGPAEIDDMLADYAETVGEGASAMNGRLDLWPVTLVQPPPAKAALVPFAVALERVRRAAGLATKELGATLARMH
jgi:hypothetical protein